MKTMIPRETKSKVALISPQVVGGKKQVRRAQPPLGIAYLAAILEERGFEVLIIDAAALDYSHVTPLYANSDLIVFGMSNEELVKKITIFKPDVIGISLLFSSQAECAFSIAKAIKNMLPDIPVVLGGIHSSVMYKEILEKEKSVDFILRGEGDYAFTEFCEKLCKKEDYFSLPGLVWRDNSQIHSNQMPDYIKNIDDLPFPAWHLMDMENYFKIGMPHNPFVKSNRVGCIMTSRGCPQRCYFCSSSNHFGHTFRPMSSKRVIEMISYMVEKFNIKELQIEDDNFTLDYKRVIEICQGIKHLKLRITFPNGIRADVPKNHKQRLEMFKTMHDAGGEQVGISVEHGDQEFLNNTMCKKQDLKEVVATCDLIHKAGLLVHANFMIGFPFETAIQRQRTVEFAKNLDADSFSLSLATPLPGTPMWDIVEKNSLFIDNFNPSRILYGQVSIKPQDISVQELYEFIERTNRQLNESAQAKRPESIEKYKLFKNKTADGDRKYHYSLDND